MITNAVLAYVKCQILSRDKVYITDAVCAKFDLSAIRQAREIICKFCAPNDHYGYHGPHGKKSQRELSVHAFEEIHTKISFLDTSANPVTIACPSSDLRLLISDTAMASPDTSNDRLTALETSHADLRKTVLAMITNSQSPVQSSQPSQADTRDSVFAPDTAAYPPLSRGRSDSKRLRSGDAAGDGEFQLPRDQQRKLNKRRKFSNTVANSTASYANKVEKGVPKKSSNKPFNWGRCQGVEVVGFSGRVPDAFISRCSLVTESEVIKTDLINKGIKVTNVELKSKEIAKTRSFKVSVESHADYEKLISGDYIPKNVKIERFIYYKTFSGNNRRLGSSAKAVNASVVDKALTELNQLGGHVTNSGSTSSAHLIDNILQPGDSSSEVSIS